MTSGRRAEHKRAGGEWEEKVERKRKKPTARCVHGSWFLKTGCKRHFSGSRPCSLAWGQEEMLETEGGFHK